MDYATADRYMAKMEGYLETSKKAGLLNPKTIVVYPEYVGTWLVAANLPDSAYHYKNLSSVIIRVILQHPIGFGRWMLKTGNIRKALFLLKSDSMCSIYNHTFSYLAKKYDVTIVAGSIVLSNPAISDGVLISSPGSLYNTSVVYGSDGGAISPVIRKASLIDEERGFTSPGKVEDLPVFSLSAGKLAVLICADSWHEKSYEIIKAQGPTLLAVPSYLSPQGVWDKPWHGDKNITEKEAWLKYAMAGKMQIAGIGCGLNVFLRGSLWDATSDGRSILRANGQTKIATGDRDQLLNIWISQ
jgi:predicted amidohydrolase